MAAVLNIGGSDDPACATRPAFCPPSPAAATDTRRRAFPPLPLLRPPCLSYGLAAPVAARALAVASSACARTTSLSSATVTKSSITRTLAQDRARS